jgi:hypothetical protein
MYGDLADQVQDPLFVEWAGRFSTTPDAVVACVQTLLDTYRRRDMLSDELLARWWSEQDQEVYKGWVNVPDFYKPKSLVLEKQSRHDSLVGWIASNGRSGAPLIVQRAFGVSGQPRDSLLRAAWSWLVDQDYLTPVELVQRRRGRSRAIAGLPPEVYVQEISRAMSKDGSLDHEGGQLRLQPEATVQIPAGLQELLRERVQRLGRDAESTLSAAAVVGRDFRFVVLKNVTDVPDREMFDALDIDPRERIRRH